MTTNVTQAHILFNLKKKVKQFQSGYTNHFGWLYQPLWENKCEFYTVDNIISNCLYLSSDYYLSVMAFNFFCLNNDPMGEVTCSSIYLAMQFTHWHLEELHLEHRSMNSIM